MLYWSQIFLKFCMTPHVNNSWIKTSSYKLTHQRRLSPFPSHVWREADPMFKTMSLAIQRNEHCPNLSHDYVHLQLEKNFISHYNSPFVSTVKMFGWSTKPCSKPGPNALHLLGSQPRRTFTTNGEPGIGRPSYKMSIVWRPEQQTNLANYVENIKFKKLNMQQVMTLTRIT